MSAASLITLKLRGALSLCVVCVLLGFTVCCQEDKTKETEKKESEKKGLRVGPGDEGPLLPGQPDGPEAKAPKKVEPTANPASGEVKDPPSTLFQPSPDDGIKRAKKEDSRENHGLVVGRRGDLKLLYKWKEVSPGRYVIYCARQDDTKIVRGANIIFYGETSECTNAVWYQYFSEKLTFWNGATELASGHIDSSGNALNPDKDTPQIDGQLPYPYQKTGTGPLLGDTPGFPERDAHDNPVTADQVISGAANKFKSGGLPNATKMKSEKTFWTYLVCIAPYKVIGHFEWHLTITVDKNATPQFDPDHEQEPEVTWVPDK